MKSVWVTIFILLIISGNAFGQKVEQSKTELKSGSSSSGTTSSSTSRTSDDEDNPFEQILLDITYGILKFTFVGDYNAEPHLDNNVTPYPFYNGESGNFEPLDSVYKNSFRIDIEDHFLYSNNNLYGNHLKAKIRPFQYFYFQGDYRHLAEQQIDGSRDQLSLFHFNFCYDRIRLEKFNFGWNLGASYVGNDVKKAGFCYGLSVDYFMTNRLSFAAAAKWSQINHQPVNSYEFNGKVHRKNHFFALGYQHLKIASPTYNFISLGAGIYF